MVCDYSLIKGYICYTRRLHRILKILPFLGSESGFYREQIVVDEDMAEGKVSLEQKVLMEAEGNEENFTNLEKIWYNFRILHASVEITVPKVQIVF